MQKIDFLKNFKKQQKISIFALKHNIMEQIGQLSNLQIELLKLFNYNLQEKQLIEIKKLLSSYFAQNITTDIDELWNKEKWDDNTINNWKNEHLRTKYK